MILEILEPFLQCLSKQAPIKVFNLLYVTRICLQMVVFFLINHYRSDISPLQTNTGPLHQMCPLQKFHPLQYQGAKYTNGHQSSKRPSFSSILESLKHSRTSYCTSTYQRRSRTPSSAPLYLLPSIATLACGWDGRTILSPLLILSYFFYRVCFHG